MPKEFVAQESLRMRRRRLRDKKKRQRNSQRGKKINNALESPQWQYK